VTPAGADHHSARVLVETQPDDQLVLAELSADPTIEFIDSRDELAGELTALRPPPDPDVVAEQMRWAYYPWRRSVVSVLGPLGFRAVRLNRNQNLITAHEQDRLAMLRIGVVGLSVGHAIAHALAQGGLCGRLRLADFDELELSNLNRVPATVFDLGSNKAQIAARRIAEIDPYLAVEVFDRGISAESVDRFLDGIDIVVEECDSLDAKILVRQAARERRIPVLMATADGGILDIERFDSEPERPILHGLLGDVDLAELAGLPSQAKIPYALRMMDGSRLSPRMAASLVEVGTTLGTWPQLVTEVIQGAAVVCEAVRRIGLGENLTSGRVRIAVAQALDEIADPLASAQVNTQVDDAQSEPMPADAVERVAAAAIRAPSGGNAQPWHISFQNSSITITLATEYTSTMDVGYRASAVAIGAAVFNGRVAAAAAGILGPVSFEPGDDRSPLRAVLELGDDADPALAALYEPMLARETNRHHGKPVALAPETVAALQAAAQGEGARLHLLTAHDELSAAARILAASDRIRYLTPHLHAEMISEVRWPGDPQPDSGIDVRSLELPEADLIKLDILRRPEVMAHLAQWDAGTALGADTRERVMASACLAVVSMSGRTLCDYARGGSAVEAVWVLAQQLGLAVQPISPVFLYAHDQADVEELSATHAHALADLKDEFRELLATSPDESLALVLRFADAPATSAWSRRRAGITSTLFA
jgi:molybdopterin/thiamine biosynthesis adenylyltransferase